MYNKSMNGLGSFSQLMNVLTLMAFSYGSVSLSALAQETAEPRIIENAHVPHWRTLLKDIGRPRKISKDTNGDLWLPSDHEVAYIYDGYKTHKIASPGTHLGIHFDEDNTAWTVHAKPGQENVRDNRIEYDGLQFYDPDTNQWNPFLVPEIDWQGRGWWFNYRIAPMKQDEFLISNPTALTSFNTQTKQSKMIFDSSEFDMGEFRYIIPRDFSSVWVTAASGVLYIERNDNQYQQIAMPFPDHIQWTDFFRARALPPIKISENTIMSVVRNMDDTQYYVMECGTDQLRITNQVKPKTMLAIPGQNGSQWLFHEPYENFGLTRILPNMVEEIFLNGITNNLFYTLNYEEPGLFSYSTRGALIHHSPPLWNSPKPLHQIQSFADELAEDQQGMIYYFNIKEQQLVCVNKDEVSFYTHNFDHFMDDRLKVLPDGRVVIEDIQKLVVFDPLTKNFESIPNPENRYVGKIVETNSSDVIVITSNFDSTNYRFEHFNGETFTPLTQSMNALQGNSSFYYVTSTHTHLVVLDYKLYQIVDKKFVPLLNNEKMEEKEESNNVTIKNILELPNGDVWLGGENLIYQYHNGGLIPVKTGVNVGSMVSDSKGNVWIGTNNGMLRYDQKKWVHYTVEDGLPDNRINDILITQTGEVWVSTNFGISQFYPHYDQDPPETFIDESALDEIGPSGSGQFLYSGEDKWKYTIPERLTYSHRIDNGTWSAFESKTNTTFNKLPFGKHTFEVRAMDRNGNVDSTPASHTFLVEYPWYLQSAFLIWSSIASLITLFFAYYAVRNYRHLKFSLLETKRTVTLLEKTKVRLTNAKAKAEEEKQNVIKANKAKDSFLARMSHEIRTPLNGILGNLELIPSSELKPNKQNFLHTAIVSARSLMEIIGDVLDFAKIEADKLELETKPTLLHHLFEETVLVMSTRAEEKQIALISSISPDVPKAVLADPVRLRQVMINLIGNAVKFTDQGSVNVSLSCSSTSGEMSTIYVEVKDTGVGFDPSRKNKLFREFEQDDTSNKTAEGTGLGLAICKRIVEKMGGTLDCDSNPKVGSVFWFDIPVTVVKETDYLLNDTINQTNQIMFKMDHPVLVVDDTFSMRELTKNQLGYLQIPCETAASSASALKRIAEQSFSMAFIDCSMPEMDGFELTQQIRANENSVDQRLPIVALTAHVVSGIRVRCHEAGMDDYLSKPVSVDDLVGMFRKWLPESVLPTTSGKERQDNIETHGASDETETPPIDLEQLKDFTKLSEPSDLVEFLDFALKDLEKTLKKLEQSIIAEDRKGLVDSSHTLKGVAQSLKADTFSSLSKDLNKEAARIPWKEVEEFRTLLTEEFSKINQYLQDVLNMTSPD